ncbi:MAG: hypothetical protein WAK53_16560 [Chromatiaceae bacterium]|jgi:hypothetical protein
MRGERERRLAELREAFESGAIGRDTYEAAVAALSITQEPTTPSSPPEAPGEAEPSDQPPKVEQHSGPAVPSIGASMSAGLSGSGAIAQNAGIAANQDSVAIGGNAEHSTIVVAQEGSTVVFGDVPLPMKAVDRQSALGRYLQHVVSRNRYLQLQGIRSGGRLVHIELDRIYIRLRGTQQRLVERPLEQEEAWLREEAGLAPGERGWGLRVTTETLTVNVEEALQSHRRLVVLGDPGSGKTTLLRYLSLPYARDLAEGTASVQAKLGQEEPHRLPILLPLRQVGAFLRSASDDGIEGHALLLRFLLRSLAEERIELPPDFFDAWLRSGEAVLLLDGMDEVPDPDLRRRVSRLVEGFVRA